MGVATILENLSEGRYRVELDYGCARGAALMAVIATRMQTCTEQMQGLALALQALTAPEDGEEGDDPPEAG